MQPKVIEADTESVLLGWQSVGDAIEYELQMRSSNASDEWKTLSNTLKTNTIRKKNLSNAGSVCFRVRAKTAIGWTEYSDVSEEICVLPAGTQQLPPPALQSRDAVSVTMKWDTASNCSGYELRMREESSSDWTTISSTLTSTVVRKKGLQKGTRYCFAVRPLSEEWAFSLSSASVTVAELSGYLKSLLSPTLERHGNGSISTETALAGKVVGLYFSAHWCGPCRQFTPSLASLYTQVVAAGKPFEVVFCSADHSEQEFLNYFSSMPWLATDLENAQEIMGKFRVNGIPRLVILSPAGQVLSENAVSGGLSSTIVDGWIKQSNIL